MRTIKDWLKIFATLPSPNSVEVDLAYRIIDDLGGYRDNSKSRSADAQNMANAMIAYAKMLHAHGVTP